MFYLAGFQRMFQSRYYLFFSGLIRGIDPLKKVFYVTTPESFDVLSMTNCLVLGNTEPPLEIISQGHMTTPCPYVLQCDSITSSSLETS